MPPPRSATAGKGKRLAILKDRSGYTQATEDEFVTLQGLDYRAHVPPRTAVKPQNNCPHLHAYASRISGKLP